MSKAIDSELYLRYKDEVLRLTNIRQEMVQGTNRRGLSDREIAERLGLALKEVIEIRCIAELESVDLNDHLEADEIKEERFKRPVKFL